MQQSLKSNGVHVSVLSSSRRVASLVACNRPNKGNEQSSTRRDGRFGVHELILFSELLKDDGG